MKYRFTIMLGLIFGLLLSSQVQSAVPEENSKDFDYVVKVLGIEQNSQAIERLKLSWPRMLSLISEMQGPVREFEELLHKAHMGGLRARGKEFSVGIMFGLIGAMGVQIGIGFHSYGLKSYLHLSTQMHRIWKSDDGGAGLAAMVSGREYRAANSNDLEFAEGTEFGSRSTVIGIGLSRTQSRDGSLDYVEKGFLVGLLGTGGTHAKIDHWVISVPIGFTSREGRTVKKLHKLLNQFVVAIHSLQLAEAAQISEEFRLLLHEWYVNLRPRRIQGFSEIPVENHVLASVQNLFEPSLFETSMNSKKSCRRALQLPATSKTQFLLPDETRK